MELAIATTHDADCVGGYGTSPTSTLLVTTSQTIPAIVSPSFRTGTCTCRVVVPKEKIKIQRRRKMRLQQQQQQQQLSIIGIMESFVYYRR